MTEQLVPFGRYLLEKRIAIGGMAEIFLAYLSGPAQFRKRVVIKRLHAHLLDNDSYVQMFLDEARIMAALSHPNLVHVHELAEIDGRYCLVMEYLEGDHARHLVKAVLKRNSKLPPQISAYIVAQAAQAADYVHGFVGEDGKPLKIVHRDLSPMNIVISWRGEVKVVDFGIAKYTGSQDTNVGVVKGTASYMSPEQARGDKVDQRSDIYSLGVVLYEMIALRRLYGTGGSSLQEAIELLRYIAQLKALPRAVEQTAMPESIRSVLRRALQPDRDRRYLSAGEMARDLESYLSETSRPLAQDLGNYARNMLQPARLDAPHLDKRQVLVDGALADPAKTIATHDLSQIIPGYDPSDPTRAIVNTDDTSSSMEFPAAADDADGLISDWSIQTEELNIVDTPLFDREQPALDRSQIAAQWAPETVEEHPALPLSDGGEAAPEAGTAPLPVVPLTKAGGATKPEPGPSAAKGPLLAVHGQIAAALEKNGGPLAAGPTPLPQWFVKTEIAPAIVQPTSVSSRVDPTVAGAMSKSPSTATPGGARPHAGSDARRGTAKPPREVTAVAPRRIVRAVILAVAAILVAGIVAIAAWRFADPTRPPSADPVAEVAEPPETQELDEPGEPETTGADLHEETVPPEMEGKSGR